MTAHAHSAAISRVRDYNKSYSTEKTPTYKGIDLVINLFFFSFLATVVSFLFLGSDMMVFIIFISVAGALSILAVILSFIFRKKAGLIKPKQESKAEIKRFPQK